MPKAKTDHVNCYNANLIFLSVIFHVLFPGSLFAFNGMHLFEANLFIYGITLRSGQAPESVSHSIMILDYV